VGGRGRYKLLGSGGPEGAPGPKYAAYVFAFLGGIIVCRLYKLPLSDQSQVTLQLRDCPIQRKEFLARPPLLGSQKPRSVALVSCRKSCGSSVLKIGDSNFSETSAFA